MRSLAFKLCWCCCRSVDGVPRRAGAGVAVRVRGAGAVARALPRLRHVGLRLPQRPPRLGSPGSLLSLPHRPSALCALAAPAPSITAESGVHRDGHTRSVDLVDSADMK